MFVILFSCKQSIFRTITSILNHDKGISSKCHMIGSKSRSLFYVTCSPREEFNSRLILCGYALRRVTKNTLFVAYNGKQMYI